MLWQYLPRRVLASKQSGFVMIILRLIFASCAWLKSWISLNPKPPSYLSLQLTLKSIFVYFFYQLRLYLAVKPSIYEFNKIELIRHFDCLAYPCIIHIPKIVLNNILTCSKLKEPTRIFISLS